MDSKKCGINEFTDCVTNETPYTNNQNKDFIVIYAVDNETHALHEEIIVSGYMDAAERIINSIYSDTNVPCAGDDHLALPILHLYSHAMELTLKSFLYVMHFHSKLCPYMKSSSIKIEKLMTHHHLGNIVQALKSILPGETNSAHYFAGSIEIFKFIDDFHKFNIDSISTRYSSDKDGAFYQLHCAQSYLKPKNLKLTIRKIINKINEYIGSDHLSACHRGELPT